MPKKNTRKNPPSIVIAKKIKTEVAELIKSRVRSTEKKKELAQALGQSLSSIQHLAYFNKGSFETVIGALIHVSGMDQLKGDALQAFIKDFKNFFKAKTSMKESDRLWYELDDELSEDEKLFWVSMLKAKIELEEELKTKKKKKRRKKK